MNRVWRERVVEYIRANALPRDKFGHQPRLYALCQTLAVSLDADDDVLFAAAWMHDIGVFIGHRPEDPAQLARWNHVPYTVKTTKRLLAAWGFPSEKLGAVARAIETHQPSDQPESLEGKILHDADLLEQLGAIGALRSAVKVGRDSRYSEFSGVVPVLRRACKELPGKVILESARPMAVQRAHTLNTFLDALEAEAGNLLY